MVDRIEQLKGWLNQTQTGVVETAVNQLYETERNKRMDMQALTEAVARAVARMEAKGVEGWGLNNPDDELFDRVELCGAHGCTSQTCNHYSHDPAAADYKIVPKSGKFVSLGAETGHDETGYEYLMLVTETDNKFYELKEPYHYWASIEEIEPANVPAWALANLAEVQ